MLGAKGGVGVFVKGLAHGVNLVMRVGRVQSKAVAPVSPMARGAVPVSNLCAQGHASKSHMALMVLSVVVQRPARALPGRWRQRCCRPDGNWLESHLSQLGGLYVGSVLVELKADGGLRAAVRGVDAHGLEVRIAPAVEGSGPAGEAVQLDLVGQDRLGIVRQVTAVISGLDANIETLKTWTSAEPHSGLALFHMEARVRLPAGLKAGDVQAALEKTSPTRSWSTSRSPRRRSAKKGATPTAASPASPTHPDATGAPWQTRATDRRRGHSAPGCAAGPRG